MSWSLQCFLWKKNISYAIKECDLRTLWRNCGIKMVILRSMIWWTICIENLQKLRVYSVEDGIDIESSCIAKTLFRCGKCLMESSSSPDMVIKIQKTLMSNRFMINIRLMTKVTLADIRVSAIWVVDYCYKNFLF